MRPLGIDLGKVRVGIAIADELGLMAHPRPHLDGQDVKGLLAALSSLARAEGVTEFVVGLPRQLDGREGAAARRSRKFAERLRAECGLPVALVDEWLSTREARARLREQGVAARGARDRLDSAAATLILQTYLDSKAAARP
jgi:putative Holliday junction resolvase